ncbi:MAG: hypothetical protein UX44_C0005G0006 [candidate division WWE3 bacterium GW2011_GWA1_46_21]|uniref:Uncharacterized protein n=3 Tax=Katanobacteria TaxID=422282 RepID=A0A0G1RNH6_UNCKA|nr:MAG: hypothetical protein UX44_C0005G0006 [candidate division WWE3 bacterium GW2011_GWA1_46_21]KKU51479.1 MAG: hypothetical protein UX73_C0001G0011 [candidate division WWE3 bacterium GW2011_GWC1_47_10]KKU57850.1 MAG: hypothetical protein UX79_C0004G0006 [candidate division WWE3 bacterium GW2011_GWB1_47_11]
MGSLYGDKQYSSESMEFGKYMESLFFDVLVDRMGFISVDREDVGKDMGGDGRTRVFAVARATEDEDWRGVDFYIYNSVKKGWVAVDLTVSRNHADLAQKDDKEKADGIYVVKLDAFDLENAAKGGETFVDAISQELAEAIQRAARDRKLFLEQ